MWVFQNQLRTCPTFLRTQVQERTQAQERRQNRHLSKPQHLYHIQEDQVVQLCLRTRECPLRFLQSRLLHYEQQQRQA